MIAYYIDRTNFTASALIVSIRLSIFEVMMNFPSSPLSYNALRAYGHAQGKRAVVHSTSVKGYRMNDNRHSIAIRKHIKGPLMVVAIVTAMDLVQLLARC